MIWLEEIPTLPLPLGCTLPTVAEFWTALLPAAAVLPPLVPDDTPFVLIYSSESKLSREVWIWTSSITNRLLTSTCQSIALYFRGTNTGRSLVTLRL